MLSLIIFMVALALLPTVLALREWRLWWHLHFFGEEMPVQVQHKWAGKIGITKHYYLIYEFEVEGEDGEYFFNSRYTEIERPAYYLIEAGEIPTVRYSRINPRLFRLEGQPFELTHWTFSTIIAWAAALFFIAIGLMG